VAGLIAGLAGLWPIDIVLPIVIPVMFVVPIALFAFSVGLGLFCLGEIVYQRIKSVHRAS
jgi:hypothetical protein